MPLDQTVPILYAVNFQIWLSTLRVRAFVPWNLKRLGSLLSHSSSKLPLSDVYLRYQAIFVYQPKYLLED